MSIENIEEHIYVYFIHFKVFVKISTTGQADGQYTEIPTER